MTDQTQKSKILLFGEYGVIYDSMALSIPYDDFEGELTMTPKRLDGEEAATASNKSMKDYLAYLLRLEEEGELIGFDFTSFSQDIENGMVFDSSIPQGFGVGSSGALVAAIYRKYAINPILPEKATGDELAELKVILAIMESYFHGTSSGLDPLICYLRRPVLVEKSGLNSPEMMQIEGDGKGAIFLIDTGAPGETAPLVDLFLRKTKEEGFLNIIKKEMIPHNDDAIKAYVKGEVRDMLDSVKELSKFLLNHLRPMIPERFVKVWKNGLETDAYTLKLCGSGGGGFLLGFTKDFEKAKEALKDHDLRIVRRF